MGYRLMGRAHAGLHHTVTGLRGRLADQSGQGTVEYVALILLVAGVLTAVVAAGKKGGDAGISTKLVETLKEQIESVGGSKGK